MTHSPHPLHQHHDPARPFAAFRGDCVPGDRFCLNPRNVVLIATAPTASDAMTMCNAARAADRAGGRQYFVASADYPIEETST